jgi:hypothetical protein
MRFFFKLVLLLIFVLPLTLIGVVYLIVDTQPMVNRVAEVTPDSIGRAKRILEQNDPRKLKSGTVRTISTRAADIDLAANYLARQFANGSARIQLHNDQAQLDASLRLPVIPIGVYVNVAVAVAEEPPLLKLASLQVGKLSVPPWLAQPLIAKALGLWLSESDLAAFRNAVKSVNLKDSGMAVTYQWHADLEDKLRAVLLPPEQKARLRRYHDRLVEVSRNLSAPKASLTEFLVPLFKLVAERSAENVPVAESRAAILVLTIYVNGEDWAQILPEAKSWPKPAKHVVLLNQRDDFPKHFIISAALAADAGGPLADAVGIYKEIADSRGGSGFSFNDIAADRAGTRFGEHAANRSTAKTLAQKLSAGVSESDLMPATQDLPEFMPEAEFKRRYGGVDGANYKKMMAEIERRVTALPLYR